MGFGLVCGTRNIVACAPKIGISIEKDLFQCEFIKKRIANLDSLPDQYQEVGLEVGSFFATSIATSTVDPQPPKMLIDGG